MLIAPGPVWPALNLNYGSAVRDRDVNARGGNVQKLGQFFSGGLHRSSERGESALALVIGVVSQRTLDAVRLGGNGETFE